MNPSFALAANLAPTLGVKATDQLALFLGTNLVHLKLAGDAEKTTLIFKDAIPLGVGALFALSGRLDVAANLGFGDLKHAGDDFTIGAGVNVRL